MEIWHRTLVGEEDSENRLLQSGGPIEFGDTVVREHRQQALPELVG